MDFGKQLRNYRQKSRDPVTGRQLTQSRFVEMLENVTGLVYSSAAISKWERGHYSINHQNRLLLIGITRVLYQFGGIQSIEEADSLLNSGGYSRLNESEALTIFGQDIVNMASPQYTLSIPDQTEEEVDLSHSGLKSIPNWLLQMNGVEHIDLSYNQLSSLPNWIRELKHLKHLDLRGNHLSIPDEVLEQTDNPNLILENYFVGGSHPLHEVKVLLVGQGAVGKTSLMRRLTDGSFDSTEATTHGINVRKYSVNLDDTTSIQINFWDFGGQAD